MLSYIVLLAFPITLTYFNYNIYIKLEDLYKKLNKVDKKINYFIKTPYIKSNYEAFENIYSNSNIIRSNNIPNSYIECYENKEDKIYLVL